jgi:hypothetical protein
MTSYVASEVRYERLARLITAGLDFDLMRLEARKSAATGVSFPP